MNHHAVFQWESYSGFLELNAWIDEGDFECIFPHSWRSLRLWWTSCPFHFSGSIVGFLLISSGFFLDSSRRRRKFPFTPHQSRPSGVTEVFLLDKFVPERNSQWLFWARRCVFVCLFVCLLACLLACLLGCLFVCLFVCACVRACVRVHACVCYSWFATAICVPKKLVNWVIIIPHMMENTHRYKSMYTYTYINK